MSTSGMRSNQESSFSIEIDFVDASKLVFEQSDVGKQFQILDVIYQVTSSPDRPIEMVSKASNNNQCTKYLAGISIWVKKQDAIEAVEVDFNIEMNETGDLFFIAF